MPYAFANSAAPTYQPGALFLGRDGTRFVGIKTDRHALTVAGSRAGKGAGLLIPNARLWPENMLYLDPKGEGIEASFQYRLDMGQTVRAIDPFESAQVPAKLRVSFNPLAEIDPAGFTAREDIEVIADGIVKRADPRHAQWDDGAAALLAGIAAFVVETAPPHMRDLTSVRSVLLGSNEDLYRDAQFMSQCTGCGGLARAAGVTLMTALTAEKGMEKDFLEGARRHSRWLDSPPIAAALKSSSFSLSELKTGAVSVYVILPPQYIQTHAAFLRLFVRCGINAMASNKGRRKCLFMLDEFHSLGRIEEVARAAGLMPGYGVHLWPFLQDLGQLQELYGERGSHTFFGNADVHTFFGNADLLTLNYVSAAIGAFSPDELADAPPQTKAFDHLRPLPGAWDWSEEKAKAKHHAIEENQRREYQHTMAQAGRPRMTSEQIKELVAKRDQNAVAASMIVFGKGRDVFNLQLAPYFVPGNDPAAALRPQSASPFAGMWENSNNSAVEETADPQGLLEQWQGQLAERSALLEKANVEQPWFVAIGLIAGAAALLFLYLGSTVHAGFHAVAAASLIVALIMGVTLWRIGELRAGYRTGAEKIWRLKRDIEARTKAS